MYGFFCHVWMKLKIKTKHRMDWSLNWNIFYVFEKNLQVKSQTSCFL